MSMDSPIDFKNVDDSQFDTSYSIGGIEQQQSISDLLNTNETTAINDMDDLMAAQATERWTRDMPSKTQTYVSLSTKCVYILLLQLLYVLFHSTDN